MHLDVVTEHILCSTTPSGNEGGPPRAPGAFAQHQQKPLSVSSWVSTFKPSSEIISIAWSRQLMHKSPTHSCTGQNPLNAQRRDPLSPAKVATPERHKTDVNADQAQLICGH